MNATPKQQYQLTVKQKKYLEYIQQYLGEKGESPTFKEIGAKFEVSWQTARKYVRKLEDRGWLTYMPGAQRSITLLQTPNTPTSNPVQFTGKR